MSIDLSQFVGEFLQESFEGLDLMEANLLSFTGDAEVIDSIFRAAHSIKGGAGTFGFSDIAKFTHGVEAILDEMRSNGAFANDGVVNLLLESVDLLRSMLQATQDEGEIDHQVVFKLDERIQQVLQQHCIPVDELKSNSSQEPEVLAIADKPVIDDESWVIEFKPSQELLKTGNEPLYIFEALAELGSISIEPNLDKLIETDDFDPENLYVSWVVKLKVADHGVGDIRESIDEVFEWVEDYCELKITAASVPVCNALEQILAEDSIDNAAIEERCLDEVESAQEVAQKEPQETKQNPSIVKKKISTEVSSVRVDTEKLDELMNRVGELVVTQAMLAQALEGFQRAGHQDQRLEQGILQLEGNTRDLQEGVMRMRMLPISFVFNRFPRLVHDACNNLSKKARLEINGAQTEIDKTVMEKIGDPLTHLIRNALDHGLELPQDRINSSKPEEGVISLNAYHQNGFVVIDIADDGKGLDIDKIREKAIAKKIITTEQNLSDEEIQALIFKAGFSTADQLSELSGRGVGMDVVLRNIESLGGQVGVTSFAGKGSTFKVKVPLTLAIIEGQLIHVGDDVYVLPLVSILETVFIKQSEIRNLGAYSHFMSYRDEYIHLIELNAIFDSNKTAADMESLLVNGADSLLVIVTESGGKKVGLVIDQLAGQQQFVVKPLEINFRKVHGLVGGTILGDGSVALILDTAGLIARDEYRNNVVPIRGGVTAVK